MSAAERLAERRAALAAAEREVRRAEADLQTSRRSVARAEAELRDYFEEVAAGEREVDSSRERELREALRQADSSVVARATLSHGKLVGVDVANPEVEGRLAGAQRLVQRRRAELAAFAREHLPELAAERAEQSLAVGRAFVEAARALGRAEAAWSTEARWWSAVLREAGREDLVAALPDPPIDVRPADVAELDRVAAAGTVAPLPAGLLGGAAG